MAQDFLESVLNPDSKMNTCVDYAVNGILRGPHTASLSEIREEIGYSRKHFIELFKKRVGVTPKAYLRIMRFQKAVNEIESGGNINWPAIALECGFYDQAHFINEFRGFSGFTPNTYLNQKNGNLNYVPVR